VVIVLAIGCLLSRFVQARQALDDFFDDPWSGRAAPASRGAGPVAHFDNERYRNSDRSVK
jgi:hypothetical protein